MSLTLHTNFGPLKIELFAEACPNICQNFIALCASNYYNNKLFYRNITNFLLQGVLPENTKNTKNEISIYYNTVDNTYMFNDEIVDELRHNKRGMLAMANKAGKLNTITSQFYILYSAQSQLDGTNSVFGQLIGAPSYDTLAKIEAVEVDEKDRPKQHIRIENITIHANPFAT